MFAYFSLIDKIVSGKSLTEVHVEIRSNKDDLMSTIDGKVGGRVTHESKTNPEKSSTFDLNAQRKAKKRARPIDQQESYESRRVWLQASEALKRGDLIAASAHKQYVEKQQRVNLIENKLANVGLNCKFFIRVPKTNKQAAPVLNVTPDDEVANQFKWIFKNQV